VSGIGRLFALGLGNGFAEDGDAAIGTNGGAERTTCAFMQGVEQHDGAIPFAVEGVGECDYIGRTGFAAKFATFAALDVDYNSTFCHCGKLLVGRAVDSVGAVHRSMRFACGNSGLNGWETVQILWNVFVNLRTEKISL
jgi:hypothetical protein